MDLSIVIPCYNMERYLSICLDSVVEQDIPKSEYEIIIINDGSMDNSLKIAENYCKNYLNVRVITQANSGLGAVRNKGMDAACGKYIYFLDSDDYIAPNILGKLLNVMETNELDILTFDSRSVTDNDNLLDAPTLGSIENLNYKTGVEYVASDKYKNEVWWYIINKQFLESTEIRFIVGRWMEDALFTSQLFCKARKMAHLPIVIHGYRKLPTSAMRSRTPEHYNKLIDDLANAAISFQEIIKKVPEDTPNSIKCKSRLRTRQQSLVFFYLVRYLKSNLPLNRLPENLAMFEKKGAYPLQNFIGPDFHGISFSVLTFIFNHKLFLYPFATLFRLLYPTVK